MGKVLEWKSKTSLPDAQEIFVEDLRGVLWCPLWVNRWKELADKARLNYNTVRNFASETTKRPRGETLFRLYVALGAHVEVTYPPELQQFVRQPRRKRA